MNKKLPLSILILIMASIMAYGQQITFQKNVNHKANELFQSLNKGRDSLHLKSKSKEIQQIDIFSEDYSKHIAVNSRETKIDLSQLPFGNFVVQAKVDKKWIVMYLEKNEDINNVSSNSEDINYDHIESPGQSAPKTGNKKKPLYYWVVAEKSSNFGSSKSMKLEYREDIAKLISKNKLELKSNTGRDNKLLIYTVYNKSKFMSMQLRNPNYYKSAEHSNYFNTEPYYASSSELSDDTRS